MTETMGPNEAEAPAKVLDLLSPLPDCAHDDDYCVHCGALIVARDGEWVYVPTEHQRPECGGPRCYSGYGYGLKAPDGGNPFHTPGGTAPCSTCWARGWRDR